MNAVLGNGAMYTKRKIMFEFAVDTRFYYKGKLCEVIEQGNWSCSGCVFFRKSERKEMICDEDFRRDHNRVLFKEVEQSKEENNN